MARPSGGYSAIDCSAHDGDGRSFLVAGWKQTLLRRTADMHHRVLHIATMPEPSAPPTLPRADAALTSAEQLLDQLAGAGICRMEMNPEGTTLFISRTDDPVIMDTCRKNSGGRPSRPRARADRVEKGESDGQQLVAELFPHSGKAHIVGFTGAPVPAIHAGQCGHPYPAPGWKTGRGYRR